MRLSRWVFLVLCGLLCIVLVVPVQSATDLVENGDFSLGTAPDSIDGWVRDVTKAQAALDYGIFRSAPRSLTSSGQIKDMSYSQCVDTSGITTGVDVGGSIYTTDVAAGSIVFTLHTDDACANAPLGGGATLVATDVSEWLDRTAEIDLPDGGGTYVKVTLNVFVPGSTYEPTYFDDIFVQESAATGVLVVQPSASAPTGLIAAAVLVGLAAVIALLRRH